MGGLGVGLRVSAARCPPQRLPPPSHPPRVADEVLYQSHIHPEQPAFSLTPQQAVALHGAILDVCRQACEVEADSARFPPTWLFHYR